MNRKDEYAKLLAEGTPYDQMIREAADANGVNYDYLHKKIFNESSFNPTAKSPTGPRGLGQFTKATGRAYGLVTDEDFNDPQKSINAAAALTRDLLGTYKGDYLKAALAYNQGNGRLGAPQLAALDRGDFSKISPEGQKYMANLLDVAGDSPSRKWFDQPNAPKLNGDFEQYTDGIAKGPKVQRVEAPDRQGFNLSQGDAPQTKQSFQEMDYAQNGPKDDSWFKNTFGVAVASIDNSWGGMKLRDMFREEEHDPLADYSPIQAQWDDEDYKAIADAGIPPSMFSFLMDRTHGVKAELPNAIKVAKENLANQKIIDSAPIGSQLIGGLAAAPLDPVSYVPVPGAAGASFAARVAKQAAFTSGLSVASEGLRSEATGLEAHYANAAVAGAVMGGGMAAILDRYIAKGVTSAQARPDMADADLEAILARHGEASQKNSEVPLVDGMEPVPAKPPVDAQDDAYLEKILGLHGERYTKQEGRIDMPDDTIEGILARHQDSSEPNVFYGTTARLQAREEARLAGKDDPTRSPWNSDDVPESHDGVDYVDVPGEPGAVRLRDGSILSATNPINPKTLRMVAQLEPERSARGFNLGAIAEIGYTLNRTEDEAIRKIGGQLFRSTVQTESGTNGKFGATASDIIERIRGEDHIRYGQLNDLTESALKEDPRYATKPGIQSKQELLYRRVAEAIEDQSKQKVAQLSKQEKALHDLINEHFTRKQDILENPAQFGNSEAKSLLDSTRHGGSYVPNVYDDFAKAAHIKKFGGEDGLQRAIQESWLASYASRPAVKARVDKMIKEAIEKDGKVATPEAIKAAVTKYANDKAYGIAHTADFNRSSMIDDGLNSLVGAENNNFLEARNLFDSDVSVPLSDGSSFAVNDLRLWDMPKIMSSYDRRINGDVGIMGSMGIDTKTLKDQVLAIRTKQGNSKEIDALESAVKLLTGRARRDPDSTFGTFLRSLNDLSFFTKNAYMAAQNFTEVAGMVTNGHLRMMLHGVPFLREMTTWGSKIRPEQLKEMHGLIFGRELDDAIRPRRADIVDRLRSQGASKVAAQMVGTLKYGTQELAAISPFTKMLTETSNYIIEAGRQGALMDMINAAHGAEAKIFTPDRLRQLSISEKQFGDIKAAINQHIVKDGDGFKIKDPEALRRDPRTMDMWRVGDKVADETILRPHKLSSQDSKALGAGWHMALQFKKFVLRTLNARLVRTVYNVSKADDRMSAGLDAALQVSISTGLATAFYVAQRYVQAQGMPQENRKEFLANSFTPEMMTWAAASRGNILGAPIGAANFVLAPLGYDPAAAVRTSILPRGPEFKKREHPTRYNPLRSDGVTAPLAKGLEQVPGAGILGSIYQVGANANGIWNNTPRNSQEQGYKTGLYNGLRGLVPNDPFTQRALSAIMQSQGMEYRQR
ncbi:membrane-bound lytic murein transglycosylase D [Pseudomonas phage shl2]|uniref:Membrane-bound lytic murein transglycosylase D n=1 Tax=Pseudomonas phage shl2 TaxID=1729933 RepID=A0A160SVM4_9CAUD|nr:internal virion protein with endolysin domain [Pseudomonas phage shl2]UAV89395.1 internal virion protein D [Pseudomonas phage FMS]CUR50725.1 membrane-bound lytic murein transglycosylase D [Pseudomonas phage shl2]